MLTVDEENQYFEAARRYPNLFDLGRLIMQQGCRPEELLEARKHAVDLTRSVLRIVHGKTKAARRTLKLTDESRAILKRRLATAGPFCVPGPEARHTAHEIERAAQRGSSCDGAQFRDLWPKPGCRLPR